LLFSSIFFCIFIKVKLKKMSNLFYIILVQFGLTLNSLAAYFTDAQLAAKQILASYKLLIDGGDTPFLISKINSTMSPGQLKNLLMSKSPYLSDIALIAMLTRSNPLPPGHIKQIVIANSPVTQSVMTAVQNAGLPSGILNNIIAAQTGISARAEKEKEVDYYAFQAKLAEVNLKQGYLKIENIDSVKAIAQKDPTLSGLFKLIEVLISQGDYTGAHNCLNNIHVKEGGIHSDACKLNGIRLNLKENNKSWFDMSPSQYAVIKQIYANNPETAIEARSILALTKGLEYERYPFDLQSARRVIPSNPEIVQKQNNLSGFKVYPNPGSDYTKVEIHLNNDELHAELIVYNLLGSEVSRQAATNNNVLTINTKEFNNGIYLYVLKTEQGIIEKQKVLIIK
jgi:hypothetical protein